MQVMSLAVEPKLERLLSDQDRKQSLKIPMEKRFLLKTILHRGPYELVVEDLAL